MSRSTEGFDCGFRNADCGLKKPVFGDRHSVMVFSNWYSVAGARYSADDRFLNAEVGPAVVRWGWTIAWQDAAFDKLPSTCSGETKSEKKLRCTER
ncbi:hypothetical protein D1AOALGA4SA_12612 [Olavius algarvensis Delta 1 endosymbiont]|nr:hypothetical protein D1AOALGA4SA_12612 [Olavius algarvensis Delta 1 endosymbiont]